MAVTIEQLLHNNKREEADRKEENLETQLSDFAEKRTAPNPQHTKRGSKPTTLLNKFEAGKGLIGPK
ncbi:hypothetical protein OUZ56_022409 [Daphnia magna]|uniref:Uncharacterized protein n=1 Tax=Daphnia magna TaxID=35525 RepID=A0ABR0AX01_9CRUS|nr:hypothetical protein OUZ56_022409 [Daphnia magna]